MVALARSFLSRRAIDGECGSSSPPTGASISMPVPQSACNSKKVDRKLAVLEAVVKSAADNYGKVDIGVYKIARDRASPTI